MLKDPPPSTDKSEAKPEGKRPGARAKRKGKGQAQTARRRGKKAQAQKKIKRKGKAMGGFRPSKTSAAIAAASVLAYQTTGAHAASQHLRRLQADDGTAMTRDFEYLGCFKDHKEDRILGHKLTDDTNTKADFCYDYCVDIGAQLMATQWSKECWCADDVEVDFGRHGEGAVCDRRCAGDRKEMCGGVNAFDLYCIGLGCSSSTDAADDDDDMAMNPTPSPVSPPTSTPEIAPVEGAFVDDIVMIISVEGDNPNPLTWGDSYSVGDKCYMDTTFDHDIGDFIVDTPDGRMTIKELFDVLEPGPGANGRPLYNDIQCGNGPANTDGDETSCPGLVEYGRAGCGQIGPMWDLSELE